MSLHHKLCHTLGGTLDLPHAQTHTVVLPHALAYNQPAAPAAAAALSRALGGTSDPARELWELAGRLGAPRSLAELGMTESDVPRIAELAVARPYANPRPVTRDGVERLLRAAWAGDRPAPSAD
jgi:maleylacetate reductase